MSGWFACAGFGWVGQVVVGVGGPQTRANSWVQAVSHGHPVGRCTVTRRAEVAIRAGTAMSLRRTVWVVALARAGPVMVAAARVRLTATTARISQAEFAVNDPDGRWASVRALVGRDTQVGVSQLVQPGRAGQRQHRHQTGARHEVRIVEHR